MQRSGTSREFTVKRQGHIHNRVYKLRDLLARSPGGFMCERWCFFSGGYEQVLQETKENKELLKRTGS
jgi:hypothetical protein